MEIFFSGDYVLRFTYDMTFLIQRKSSYEKRLEWKPYKRQKGMEVSV